MNIRKVGNLYMHRVLVTGGAGFIGSHLCEALVSIGCYVVSLDNYFTGSISNHVIGVDYINDSTVNINKLSLELEFDTVYHLGEYSRVEQSFDDIEKVLEYNAVGTNEVLEFCRRNGSKLIYAGSSTKFGDNGPNSSPYAFTKLKNTELVRNYGDWFGLDYAITYFYNVYGGRELSSGPYATVVAKFLDAKRKGKTVTVNAPGTQERNFTYIEDTINALILVGKHGSGDGYGIGNDKSYTIFEIADMMGLYYNIGPEKKGNRLSASVVSDKTRELGWKPRTDLKAYLELVLNYA